MRIGELARRTGLTRDTIRFYEREGLIESHPSADATNNYRIYPEELVERLAMIGDAREAGLPLADIRALTECMEFGDRPDFDAEAFLAAKIAELRRTIASARKLLHAMEATKRALDRGPLEWREDAGSGAKASQSAPSEARRNRPHQRRG